MSVDLVHTIYVHADPDDVWRGLTSPELTAQYWFGLTFDTDWLVGSPMAWKKDGLTLEDAGQVVLESEPGRRLSYAYHSSNPEWAAANGVDIADAWQWTTQPRSTVQIDIEPVGEVVRLTVHQGPFNSPDSLVLAGAAEGWPLVLSGLKTLLETGRPMPGFDGQS